VECVAVEDSDLFAQTFDGVTAWGLFFLLDAEVQRKLVKKIAGALQSSSKFLRRPLSRKGALSLPRVEPDL
jgi:hypothetical protein